MKTLPLIAITSILAAPVLAEETRQLDAHEHGVGQLTIAVEGGQIAMELHAPGADIVGFEYEAESEADLAKIAAASTTLSSPLALFAVSADAGCTVTEAHAGLKEDADHDDHGDEDHDDDHKDEDHDDEDHDVDHKDDDHDDEDHDNHKDEASHTEFHAEYMLTCTNPSALTEISFAYFDVFPNAKEVEVQIVSDKGATAFEVERDAPVLDLSGAL